MHLSHRAKQVSILSLLLTTGGVQAVRNNVESPPFVPSQEFASCLNKKSLKFILSGSCSFDHFKDAVETRMATYLSCRKSHVDGEIMAVLDVNSMHDARRKLDELCREAVLESMQRKTTFDFEEFSDMDHDFNKAFFDGGSSWIDGGMSIREARTQNLPTDLNTIASNKFHGDSRRINAIVQKVAHERQISWPDSIENFRHCAANAAMCCWVDHDETRGVQYARNTDLCYVDYSRATSSSHMETGLGLFGGMQDAFCHGFAWDEDSLDDLFKGNLLFLSEVYDNMHNKGLSKNVAGAPMCGCIEQMPIVTRADCSTLELSGDFIFRHTYRPVITNMIKALGQPTINVVDCPGIDGKTNDLGSYYDKLFLEGRVNDTQKILFKETLIGDDDCDMAMQDIMSGYMPTMDPSKRPVSKAPTSSPTRSPSKSSSYTSTYATIAFPTNTVSKLSSSPSLASSTSHVFQPTSIMTPTVASALSPDASVHLVSVPHDIPCSGTIMSVELHSASGDPIVMRKIQVMSSDVDLALDGIVTKAFSSIKIELKHPHTIDSVKIHNFCGVFTDTGCYCELSGARLTLRDNNMHILAERTFGDTCSMDMVVENFVNPHCSSEYPSEPSSLQLSSLPMVVCGGHTVPTCAECPLDHAEHPASSCNGDCRWDNVKNACVDASMLE